MTVTFYLTGGFQELLQRRSAAFGLPLLESAQHGIKQDRLRQPECRAVKSDRQRDLSGNDQDVNQRTQKLMKKDKGKTGWRLAWQQVRSVLTQAGLRFTRGQPQQTAVQPGQNFRVIQSIPGYVQGCGLCYIPAHHNLRESENLYAIRPQRYSRIISNFSKMSVPHKASDVTFVVKFFSVVDAYQPLCLNLESVSGIREGVFSRYEHSLPWAW